MKIEKTVDRGSKEKLYVQIYSIIHEKIESGEWPSGEQIPPEDELCRIYDVSKVTVREAVQELVREGYLARHQGKGTFVTYSVPHLGIVMRTRLSEDIFGEEVKARKEVLERGFRKVTDDIKKILMAEDADIYYILSRKVVDGELFSEEVFVPSFILPGVETEEVSERSFLEVIEEKGTKKISRVMQTVEVADLKRDLAVHLDMKENSCALVVGRIFFSSDGSPIAYSRCILGAGNTVKMEFERIK